MRFDLGLAQRRGEAVALPPELVQHQDDLPAAHAEQSAGLHRDGDDPPASRLQHLVHPAQALATFLRALGVPAEQVPVDVAEAGALYRTLVSDRRLLVILDNAASADQIRPLLPGGARCVTLVTSRDPGDLDAFVEAAAAAFA